MGAVVASSVHLRAASFEDIQYWAGNGTNRAALVIDWKDGQASESLLWGFRWNGTATGLDMLEAVATADSRLFAHLGQYSWGPAVLGIGYDLNSSGAFAVNPALAFNTGGVYLDAGGAEENDARVPGDAADHYAEGWTAAYWAYYLKGSSTASWTSASTGASGRTLADGVWDGYSFAANFNAVAPAEPAAALPSPYAFEIAASQGPLGAAPYDDPASVLGMPSTQFYDAWGSWSGGTSTRRVKLVEPAYNLDATQSHKLITTLPEGSAIVARFEQPITDDSAHPYGIDFLVFGNTFYTASGFVSDSSDMNTLLLSGGEFSEPMKVSVSPGYTGKPGQTADDWRTWDWYRYENGPYADSAFPTQAYRWNRASAAWTEELMDFTKPVNPALGALLSSGGMSAADAIDLYDGSGGGTGFDLAESGFAAVQYVKIEGLTNYAGGEVDAISTVRPAVVGDSLTLANANLTNGTATLRFQRPGLWSQTALALSFTQVSEVARVATVAVPDTSLADYGQVLAGARFTVAPVLGSNVVAFAADARLGTGSNYRGTGQDLALLRQVGTDWESVNLTFDAATRNVLVPGVTNAATYALIQIQPPKISLTLGVDGFGGPLATVKFAALPGWTYTLERTLDFNQWEAVASQSPLAAGWTVLRASGETASAFYRLRVSRQ